MEEGMFLTLLSTALADVHILIGPFKDLCLNVNVLIPSSGRYCEKPGWGKSLSWEVPMPGSAKCVPGVFWV